jgi:C1A family cysteine protease
VETNQPTNIPTDDELKAALCNYGPIAVAVYVPTQDDGSATYAWAMNHGDPLGDFVNDPNRGISHVVLLIGWDDNVVTSADGTQKGAWIFKNSWGEWGIPIKGNSDVGSGFGYVKYGNNNIGLGAAWVTPVASQ